MLELSGRDNIIKHPENVILAGTISGNNNSVIVRSSHRESFIKLHVHGDNNTILIGDVISIKNFRIACGNHIPANNTKFTIGNGFSVEPGSEVMLYNHNCTASIGDDCLFSKDIVIRCGESPHLLFDSLSGEYLDKGVNLTIGNHVWIGERVYITKNAKLPSRVIVGACSVVTKAFEREDCVIAGNPARITRENVRWIRNRDFIPKGSVYEAGFLDYLSKL